MLSMDGPIFLVDMISKVSSGLVSTYQSVWKALEIHVNFTVEFNVALIEWGGTKISAGISVCHWNNYSWSGNVWLSNCIHGIHIISLGQTKYINSLASLPSCFLASPIQVNFAKLNYCPPTYTLRIWLILNINVLFLALLLFEHLIIIIIYFLAPIYVTIFFKCRNTAFSNWKNGSIYTCNQIANM